MRLPISYTLIPEATKQASHHFKTNTKIVFTIKQIKGEIIMKKLVGIGLAAAISLGALSGCSLLGEKANGFVLYGTEDQVTQIADKNKKRSERKRLL